MSTAAAGGSGKRRRNRRGKGGKGRSSQESGGAAAAEPEKLGPFTITEGQLQGPSNGGSKPTTNVATKKKRRNRKKQSQQQQQQQAQGENSSSTTGTTKTAGVSSTADDPSVRIARFNTQLRVCVEQHDLPKLRELLYNNDDDNDHDKTLKLDVLVMESVLKTYVMEGMLEEALHVLKNCKLLAAESLSVAQVERVLTRLPQTNIQGRTGLADEMIRYLCLVTAFDSTPVRNYFGRIVRGIALEFLEQAAAARHRITTLPCSNLVREGLCVGNAKLQIHKRGGKKNTKLAELVIVPGEVDGFVAVVANTTTTPVVDQTKQQQQGIRAGDVVAILPYQGTGPLDVSCLDRATTMVEAVVIKNEPLIVRLQDRKSGSDLIQQLEEGNVFRIDKLAHRTSYQRQLAAAVIMASPAKALAAAAAAATKKSRKDPRCPCPQLVKALSAAESEAEDIILAATKETSLSSLLCGRAVPWHKNDGENDNEDVDDEKDTQDALRESCATFLNKYNTLVGLNDMQKRAVEQATSNRLTLVLEGGTDYSGKTAVSVRILEHWTKVAAAAATAQKREEEPEEGVTPWPILVTSESNLAIDSIMEGCAAVGIRVARLGRPEAVSDDLLPFCIDQPSSRNETSAPPFKERVKRLKTAQVVCCTCVDSARDILDALGPLERVLVDEADQIAESAMMVPLVRGCRQLVLIGGSNSKVSHATTRRAAEEGHGVSLFTRMVNCGVSPVHLEAKRPSEEEQLMAEKKAEELQVAAKKSVDERLEIERVQAKRIAAENKAAQEEAERIAAVKREEERISREKAEEAAKKERELEIAAQKREKERVEAERISAEKAAQAEAERIAAVKREEEERISREKAEEAAKKERELEIVAENAKREKERVEAEIISAEKAAKAEAKKVAEAERHQEKLISREIAEDVEKDVAGEKKTVDDGYVAAEDACERELCTDSTPEACPEDNMSRGIPSLDQPAAEETGSKQSDCQDCQCVIS